MSNELKAKEVRVYKGNEITKREAELHPALKNIVGFVSKQAYDILLNSRPTEPKEQEPKTKWISVDDRLPIEDIKSLELGWVLVFADSAIGCLLFRKGQFIYPSYAESSNVNPDQVTHWQPLPDAPICEEGKEDE